MVNGDRLQSMQSMQSNVNQRVERPFINNSEVIESPTLDL